MEHGMEIGKFFDEAFLVQGIKASQITVRTPVKDASGAITGTADSGGFAEIVYTDRAAAGDLAAVSAQALTLAKFRTAPEGFKGATAVILDSVDDELDSVALELAIQDMCQNIEEKDVDVENGVILLRPAQYYTLLRNSLLLDKDFSTSNGDYAQGKILASNGVRIQKTNRFPTEINVDGTNDHYLSNAGNGLAYNVTATDLEAMAVLLMPKALLAGETIPLTSKVYYVDQEFQWFIDSYLSFGVTPNDK